MDKMAVQSTKDKLLDAAVNLFSEKGYDGTSVDEIAASIGIKGPTLYKHFKGKEALLTAIMERTDHEYEKGMGIRTQKALEIHSGEALKAFSMHQILFTLNNENVRKMRRLFTIEQYRNAGFAKRATRHQIKNMQEQFIQIFKRMMDAGEMRRGFTSLQDSTATHSSILAWRIPWKEKPGRLQSIGSQIVGHN